MEQFSLMDLLGLQPFNPETNKPISLPGGMQATEYTTTSIDPNSGKYMIHPQIWFNGQEPKYLQGEAGLQAALIYEMNGGNAFPRFDTAEEADAWARNRSQGGGGLLSMAVPMSGGN